MRKPKVGVIILNWNGREDTLECLASIAGTKNPAILLKVYIVDNASTDGAVDEIRKKYPEYTVIQNDKNLGFSGGNNVGIRKALEDGCASIILLNNDTTVSKHTFNDLFIFAKKAGFEVASPKIYFSKGREFHQDSYTQAERGKVIWYAGGRMDWANVIAQHVGVDEVDHGQFDKAVETDFATGCCMLISKKVLDSVGLLDDTFIAYYEDNDFSQKAIKAGFKVGYVPQAHLWHKNAGSSGGSGSAKQNPIVARSRYLFGMRHASLRAKLALTKEKYLILWGLR